MAEKWLMPLIERYQQLPSQNQTFAETFSFAWV